MTATRKKYGGEYLPNNSITRSRRPVILSKSLLRNSRRIPFPSKIPSKIPSTRHSKSPSKLPFIFLIEGMGCSEYNENEKEEFADHIGIKSHEIDIICNIKNLIKNIVKTTCYLQPLKNEPLLEKLADKLLDSAKEYPHIYVYGTSFGGMITNRIAEIFTKRFNGLKNEREKEVLHGLILKMHFSTFGSIYISKKIAAWIDIINYIAIGDVANTCTRQIEHKQAVKPDEIEKNYKPLIYYFRNNKLAYKEREKSESSGKIIDICLYKRNKKDDKQFTINCNKVISHIPIFRAINEWKVHNSYFPLIFDMMGNKTTHIDEL